jgi:hypothetical protein
MDRAYKRNGNVEDPVRQTNSYSSTFDNTLTVQALGNCAAQGPKFEERYADAPVNHGDVVRSTAAILLEQFNEIHGNSGDSVLGKRNVVAT